MRRIESLSAEEIATCQLAIGRIFRMGSRHEQPGDGAEYVRCRNIVMDIMESDETTVGKSHKPAPGWNFGESYKGRIE